MKKLADIQAEQQAARPTYFDDPNMDAMLAKLLELAEENCVLRDRVLTAQKLAADGKPCDDAAIDAYEMSDEEMLERLDAHKAYYAELMASLV